MRRFIVIGHDAPIDPEFSLSDLPGTAGRLDVLCRCVTAGLLRSHGIRPGTEVTTIHQDQLAIRFQGSDVRHLNPDERSTAARFRTALEDASDVVGAIEVESAPGIFVARRTFDDVLGSIPEPIVQLHAEGTPITELPPTDEYAFVLSDHHSFTAAEAQSLAAVVDHRVSLGPEALHADQAITVAHNYLDTAGYRSY